LLERSMIADALITGMTGVALVAGAGLLHELLGVPVALMRYAGLILIPYAAIVFYWSDPTRLSRPRAWTVIALNLAWVAASVMLLLADWIAPTSLGIAFVLFQAVIVALFAELQYTGLRKIGV
jgi:hypothetical protein